MEKEKIFTKENERYCLALDWEKKLEYVLVNKQQRRAVEYELKR